MNWNDLIAMLEQIRQTQSSLFDLSVASIALSTVNLFLAISARRASARSRMAAPAKPVEPEMSPGECECGHGRCNHTDGKKGCHVAFEIEGQPGKFSGTCACQHFILDDDDDDESEDQIPTAQDLDRMYRG